MTRGVHVAATISAIVTVALTMPACVLCTDVPCFSTLRLQITERERAPLGPGTWELAFVVDGGTPLQATCELGPESRSATCEDMEVQVFPMIFDDPENPYTQLQVDFPGGDGTEALPQVLGVTITHDGEVVFDEQLEPSYTRSEPARCDPDCFDDSIDIVVDRR